MKHLLISTQNQFTAYLPRRNWLLKLLEKFIRILYHYILNSVPENFINIYTRIRYQFLLLSTEK